MSMSVMTLMKECQCGMDPIKNCTSPVLSCVSSITVSNYYQLFFDNKCFLFNREIPRSAWEKGIALTSGVLGTTRGELGGYNDIIPLILLRISALYKILLPTDREMALKHMAHFKNPGTNSRE